MARTAATQHADGATVWQRKFRSIDKIMRIISIRRPHLTANELFVARNQLERFGTVLFPTAVRIPGSKQTDPATRYTLDITPRTLDRTSLADVFPTPSR